MARSTALLARLQRFHERLRGPFASTAELERRALDLIARELGAWRASYFVERRGVLRLELCLDRGRWLELGDELRGPEARPLLEVAARRRGPLALRRPRPML